MTIPFSQERARLTGPWGKCRLRGVKEPLRVIEELTISRDRSMAAVSGGYWLGGLAGFSGSCYFERRGDGWRKLGCQITGIS